MKKKYNFIQISIFIVSITTFVVLMLDYINTKFTGSGNSEQLIIILTASFISIIAVFFLQTFLMNKMPNLYKVAIIGFPKSGKTTLLISLFSEIFSKKILGMKTQLTGESTIDRVNQYIKILSTGKYIGPTKTQDVFTFSSRIESSQFTLFKKVYKVDFADFPGEDSKKYFQEYGEWLHNTPFFKWTYDANALIFVIDLFPYIEERFFNIRNGYIAQSSAAIRAAWQHLFDAADSQRKSELRKVPIVIVFNKADLLAHYYLGNLINKKRNIDIGYVDENNVLYDKIFSMAYGEIIPETIDLDDLIIDDYFTKILNDFSDLTNFLTDESNSFSTVFLSSFARVNGTRFGMSELLNATLPSINSKPLRKTL